MDPREGEVKERAPPNDAANPNHKTHTDTARN